MDGRFRYVVISYKEIQMNAEGFTGKDVCLESMLLRALSMTAERDGGIAVLTGERTQSIFRKIWLDTVDMVSINDGHVHIDGRLNRFAKNAGKVVSRISPIVSGRI